MVGGAPPTVRAQSEQYRITGCVVQSARCGTQPSTLNVDYDRRVDMTCVASRHRRFEDLRLTVGHFFAYVTEIIRPARVYRMHAAQILW